MPRADPCIQKFCVLCRLRETLLKEKLGHGRCKPHLGFAGRSCGDVRSRRGGFFEGWFHPDGAEAGAGVPLFPGARDDDGAGGGSRTLTSLAALRIFLRTSAFAALAQVRLGRSRGSWSGLYLRHTPESGPGLRRCPSSLYTFPVGRVPRRAWLGIAISGFPEFEQFCIAGFPASTQAFLKSVASAVPPRPQFTIIG